MPSNHRQHLYVDEWTPPRRRARNQVADFVLQTDLSWSDTFTVSHPGISLSTTLTYSDTFGMGGGMSLSTNMDWSDTFTIGGNVGLSLSTNMAWSDSFGMGGGISLSTTATWTDSFTASAPTISLSTSMVWSDAFGIGGAIPISLSTNMVWTDEFSTTDTTATTLFQNTYAINALSSAASQYSYGFDSYAALDGTYYAVDENGLYTIGGDDDNGTDITATLRTGLNDFGAEKQKRMDSTRLAGTFSGEMIVKARVEQSGALNEHWYTSGNVTAAAPRERIVKLGKGLRSAYLQFEINNKAGADFEIDRMDFYPPPQERRK